MGGEEGEGAMTGANGDEVKEKSACSQSCCWQRQADPLTKDVRPERAHMEASEATKECGYVCVCARACVCVFLFYTYEDQMS